MLLPTWPIVGQTACLLAATATAPPMHVQQAVDAITHMHFAPWMVPMSVATFVQVNLAHAFVNADSAPSTSFADVDVHGKGPLRFLVGTSTFQDEQMRRLSAVGALRVKAQWWLAERGLLAGQYGNQPDAGARTSLISMSAEGENGGAAPQDEICYLCEMLDCDDDELDSFGCLGD